MKKFLSLITVAAIVLTSFATVAFADQDATFGLETKITNNIMVYTENFESVATWAPNNVLMSHSPANQNFIGKKSIPAKLGGDDTGRYAWYSETFDDGSRNIYAKTYGFYYKIPGFFMDKKVGTTYTVSFRAKYLATELANDAVESNIAVRSIDVGSSVNNGANIDYGIQYGVVKEDNTEWDTYTVTFTYNGVTNFTDSANEEIYDKYALCLKIYTSAYQVDGTWKFPFYGIDDIKITSPELTDTNEATFAGSNITINNTVYNNNAVDQNGKVINAIYDNAGNLRSVASADLALSAADTSQTVPVTIKVPSGANTGWTYKTMVWTDLNDTIKPLAPDANLFDENLFVNGGFEILPKTTPATAYANDNVAKGWRTGAGKSNGVSDTSGIVAVTNCTWGDGASAAPHKGSYAVKLSANGFENNLTTNLSTSDGWTGIIKANGPGTYHLSFWAIIPDGTLRFATGFNGGTAPVIYKKGTTTARDYVWAGKEYYSEKEGSWCKYELDIKVDSTTGNNNNWSYLLFYPNGTSQPIYLDDMKLTFTPDN